MDFKLHSQHILFKKWLLANKHIDSVFDINDITMKYFEFSGSQIIINSNTYTALEKGYIIPQKGRAMANYKKLKEFLLNFTSKKYKIFCTVKVSDLPKFKMTHF